MTHAMACAGVVLMMGMTACGQTTCAGGGVCATGTSAVAAGAPRRHFDRDDRRNMVMDVWGRVVPAPGEETGQGGSTTQSLGAAPPGTGGAGI
jgi:hypothetical protein